jgi:hypothetical protein
MIEYLDIENDILDDCTDTRAVECFSERSPYMSLNALAQVEDRP